MRTIARLTVLAAICAATTLAVGQDQTEKAAKTEKAGQEKAADAKKPPELTETKGQILMDDDLPATGGLVYFVFQSRLMEIPHSGSLDKVKAMAEGAAAVDEKGNFKLNMPPGNFALVYVPSGTADGAQLGPGPDSMAKARRMTREQIQARIEAIKENAQQGLPIKDGALGEAFVVENRQVRPPVVDFGKMVVGINQSVTIRAVKESGDPVDFPVKLQLRGKNGDVYDAHTPSINEAGVFVFHDVFPQFYQVFATATKPKPGEGDEATTPSLGNADLVFEGAPLEQKVTVTPGKPGDAADQPPPNVPEPPKQKPSAAKPKAKQ